MSGCTRARLPVTSIVLVFAALSVLGYLWWLVATAPEGYADERGFHLGRPDEDD